MHDSVLSPERNWSIVHIIKIKGPLIIPSPTPERNWSKVHSINIKGSLILPSTTPVEMKNLQNTDFRPHDTAFSKTKIIEFLKIFITPLNHPSNCSTITKYDLIEA